MKIFKWEFTRENAYEWLDAFSKQIAPAGIVTTFASNWITDPQTAMKVGGVITSLYALVKAIELLLKPVPQVPQV